MPIYQVTYKNTLDAFCQVMRVPDARPYILNKDAVLGAIARPYHTFAGENLYPTLHEKAGALLSGVANAHGFSDGNKRTAVLLTLGMIRKSGYNLDRTALKKLDDVVVDVVTGERSEVSVAIWFHIVTD